MTKRPQPQSLQAQLNEIVQAIDQCTLHQQIHHAVREGKAHEYAAQVLVHLEYLAKCMGTRTPHPGHADLQRLALVERFRLYYMARDAGSYAAASDLLDRLLDYAGDIEKLPDLAAIEATARASDVVAHAVRVLKPRDKQLFNNLSTSFTLKDVATAAAAIDYPPTSAQRRAVPRLHSLGLIERTDAGWAKTVPLLPA